MHLSDPRVAQIPIHECGEALVDVRATAPLRVATHPPRTPEQSTYLRYSVVERLVVAQSLLPRDIRLLVVDGHRPASQPCRQLTCAIDEMRLDHPDIPAEELHRYLGRCSTPPAAAPHPTGGAVDLTLSHEDIGWPPAGAETPATPHPTALPACCTAPPHPAPAQPWQLLASALTAAGLVNYPARWWHWSYGDRFWAATTNTPHARYGPVPEG